MKPRTARGMLGLMSAVMLGYWFLPGPLAQEQDPERPIWTTKDPWYLPPPPGLDQETPAERARWQSIKGDNIIQIKGPLAPKAEARLEKVPVVKLTLAEAEAFAGKRLSPLPDKSPYLVRSIYLNEGTGSYTVTYRDHLLVVSHGCLGARAVPMRRRPLLVFLPRTPTDVFVTCWMAE
jgi:hypothetical protein